MSLLHEVEAWKSSNLTPLRPGNIRASVKAGSSPPPVPGRPPLMQATKWLVLPSLQRIGWTRRLSGSVGLDEVEAAMDSVDAPRGLAKDFLRLIDLGVDGFAK